MINLEEVKKEAIRKGILQEIRDNLWYVRCRTEEAAKEDMKDFKKCIRSAREALFDAEILYNELNPTDRQFANTEKLKEMETLLKLSVEELSLMWNNAGFVIVPYDQWNDLVSKTMTKEESNG